jgi:hypothetical protein
LICFGCHKEGHIRRNCPKEDAKERDDTTLLAEYVKIQQKQRNQKKATNNGNIKNNGSAIQPAAATSNESPKKEESNEEEDITMVDTDRSAPPSKAITYDGNSIHASKYASSETAVHMDVDSIPNVEADSTAHNAVGQQG